MASVSDTGALLNATSDPARISFDGRYLFFQFNGDNLVSGDRRSHGDCFINDLQTAQVRRVSVRGNGTELNDQCDILGLSGDGSSAVFSTDVTNAIKNDTNGVRDIFYKILN